MKDREHPEPSNVLGVFGLSMYTREDGLEEIFSKFGRVEKISIVYDRMDRNRSRGYGFVTMESVDCASVAVEKTNGMVLDGRKIRVDYSVTQKPHSPGSKRPESERFNDRSDRRPRHSGDRFRGGRDDHRDGRFKRDYNQDRGRRSSRDPRDFDGGRRPYSPMREPKRRFERSRSFDRGDFKRDGYMSPRGRRRDSPPRMGSERKDDYYRIDRGPDSRNGRDSYMDRGPESSRFDSRERPRGGPPPPHHMQGGRGRPMMGDRSPPYQGDRDRHGRSPPRRSYGPNY
ncbi:hypothetical protein BB560_006680 [Smittium megazygosporum]|uniref:RRM domain-containing protein n=1 Tax=Smittium megazygosporum TaxID=133381 RepID=A0A2T9Y2G3_9FUNG|nr:hypothetical protein BB560_006680 [Smittium megazygosporum]